MIRIPETLKAALLADGSHKNLAINIGGKKCTNSDIVYESLELTQSIMNSDSFEFVGCIASCLKFKLHNAPASKNFDITVTMTVDDFGTVIPIFTGVVDSIEAETDSTLSTVTAYDRFYSASLLDFTAYYNSLQPTTVGIMLRGVLDLVHIPYEFEEDFFLDTITAFAGSKRKARGLTGLDIIKQCCQLYGAFGFIDATGKFRLKKLMYSAGENSKFPAIDIFPSESIYPNHVSSAMPSASTEVPFYEYCHYKKQTVKEIGKVVIRDKQDEQDPVTYGDGGNKYVVQGNIFVYDQTREVKQSIAGHLYANVAGISFTPFSAKNNGMPWIEPGDELVYTDINDTTKKIFFFMFARKMSGIQYLTDEFEADGNEYTNLFISDLQAQIDELRNDMATKSEVDEKDEQVKQEINDRIDEEIEDIDDHFEELEDHMLKATAHPDAPPGETEPNHIYFVYYTE